jgi:hypothetical protein
MQKGHATLLQHTEVRRISRGKVLTRVLGLREKILPFFKNSNRASFAEFRNDAKWLLKLAYLADIYQHLDTLYISIRDLK